MGLSLLNKYLIGVLFICLICVVPFTPNRKVIKNKNFWIGISVGILVFLPNVIWQFVNGLPVFFHLSELGRTQLVHVDRIAFLTDQIIMPSWASVLTIAGLIFLFRNKESGKFRFLGIVSILVVVLLIFMRGKSYYTIGIFPFLISAGAVWYERWLERKWIRIAVPVLLILLTIPMIPFGLPVYKSEGLVKYFRVVESKYGIKLGRRFEDGTIHSLPQDYADMIGWEELTAITARAYNSIEDKKAGIIYGENYGHAGAITIIGKKYGLPEAVCFSESFRYWIPLKFDPDIKSFIYINSKLGNDIQKLFNKITLVGMISNPDSREYGTKVYLCEDPNSSFNEFWTNRLMDLKKH